MVAAAEIIVLKYPLAAQRVICHKAQTPQLALYPLSDCRYSST